MKDEIRQHGNTLLSGTDGITIPMLFNNLSGRNFSGEEYRIYIQKVAYRQMGFVPGKISLFRNDRMVKEAALSSLQDK